jgi:hypothetical protein
LTIADLQNCGPAAAYQLVKQKQPQASLQLLWAMAAGLSGKDWRVLSDDEKESLRSDLTSW